jgi:hypothetical protein
MSASDTPRTDAMIISLTVDNGELSVIRACEFAKELERDLTNLRERLAAAEVGLSAVRASLRCMVRLHEGRLICRTDETDRECLNRVTAETLSTAKGLLSSIDTALDRGHE